MNTEHTIEDLAADLKATRETLQTLIVWLALELGEEAVDKLLSKLSREAEETGQNEKSPDAGTTENSALDLASRFHETYERLAPQFGYETRLDTRAFDPASKNGELMVAVCAEIIEQNA